MGSFVLLLNLGKDLILESNISFWPSVISENFSVPVRDFAKYLKAGVLKSTSMFLDSKVFLNSCGLTSILFPFLDIGIKSPLNCDSLNLIEDFSDMNWLKSDLFNNFLASAIV